ncbi:MAG TPA: hypothetical protein VIR03_03440 [Candidatus Saccharimonadales bacterium]
MQPDAPQKSVMDVLPPRPAASVSASPGTMQVSSVASAASAPPSAPVSPTAPASQPLAVHEPPKLPDDSESEPKLGQSQPEPKQPAMPAAKPVTPAPQAPEPERKQRPHLQKPPLPTGAIVFALLTMTALATLTVVAYLQAQ